MSIICHTCDEVVPNDHEKRCPTCGYVRPTCIIWCSVCGTEFGRVGYNSRTVKAVTGWSPKHEGQSRPENLEIGKIWVDPYWHIYTPHCPRCGGTVALSSHTDTFYCIDRENCDWNEDGDKIKGG